MSASNREELARLLWGVAWRVVVIAIVVTILLFAGGNQ
jgi:hypothetical protein